MNVANQVTRILNDRDTLRTKAVKLKLSTKSVEGTPSSAITEESNLDEIASAFDAVEDRGSVQATVKEGETYTIEKGYHDGTGTVSGVKGGGNYTLQSKTVTPTKDKQQITPDGGYYGLSDVTVNEIPAAFQNVTSVTAGEDDVAAGKIIVDKTGAQVVGKMPIIGTVDRTLDITNPSYTVEKGKHSGEGVVKIVPEAKSATPTKSAQSITPTAGKVLSKVTVDAIPDEFQDVTKVTATAGDVLAGKKIVGTDGTVIDGTIPVNGAIAKTFNVMTETEVSIPAGSTTGGKVTLTDDLEKALAAI